MMIAVGLKSGTDLSNFFKFLCRETGLIKFIPRIQKYFRNSFSQKFSGLSLSFKYSELTLFWQTSLKEYFQMLDLSAAS